MSTETLLVEIGTEELPPKALKSLGMAFRDGIVNGLALRDLPHGEVTWFATPRRLAVLISDVSESAPDKTVETLGPPADRAKDHEGNWTPAAAGFAKKQGVAPDALAVLETPKGQRLGLRKTVGGAQTADALNAIICESLAALPIPKRMRWGASKEEFVRPAHWIVAMFGDNAEHGDILGLATGNITRGHRFHAPGDITLARPQDYVSALADAKVVASFELRRNMVRDQIDTEASALKATAVIDEDLLDEVTGLVEWPVALTGSFEERFLAVPQEALILSMKEHQKYFHLVDETGALKPYFITLSNIESKDPVQVIAGNERVIRPRLSDAAFFFETDKKVALTDRVDALDNIVFQQKLGTLKDKTDRLVKLAGALAADLGAVRANAERAALLSKTDLVTDMVLEFSDMQGIAGCYYARNDHETEDVATALAQQYWPKFAGDRLPEGPIATALGLADRLDTLVGIFGIGQPPSGSRDPFALRRASLAVLRILVEKEIDLDLAKCLDLAAAGYTKGVIAKGTTDQVLEYMVERFRAWYEEEAIPVAVFKAVSAKSLSVPLDIHRRILAVNAFAQLPEAQALAAANKRVSNILSKLDEEHEFGAVNAALLQEVQEQNLTENLASLATISRQHLSKGEYTQALSVLAGLRQPIDDFFNDVMVNVEEDALRNNRLNLLRDLRELFLEVADISLLAVGK